MQVLNDFLASSEMTSYATTQSLQWYLEHLQALAREVTTLRAYRMVVRWLDHVQTVSLDKEGYDHADTWCKIHMIARIEQFIANQLDTELSKRVNAVNLDNLADTDNPDLR